MTITRSRWHLATGTVVIAYLLIDALIILNHRFIGEATWLMVHTFTLGAITNALHIWTNHFAAAILRYRADPRRRTEIALLGGLNAGVITTAAGIVTGQIQVTAIGVALVCLAVGGHALHLGRAIKRALPARFTIIVRAYLAAATLLLPGLVAGYGLAVNPVEPDRTALLAAHLACNILGWVALPIIATLLTLWPTILRAKLPPAAEAVARTYLPVLLVFPPIAALGGGLVIISPLAARIVVGVAVLAFVGVAIRIFIPLARTTWRLAKGSFPAMSVACGAVWLLATIGVVAIRIIVDGLSSTLSGLGVFLLPLLGGGIAQILIGSLSYLLPVMIGGGPRPLRVRIARIDTWASWRIVVVNLALALYLVTSASLIMVVTSLAAYLAALISVIMIIRAIMPVSAKALAAAPPPMLDREGDVVQTRRYRHGAIAGLVTLAVLVTGAVIADPVGAGVPIGRSGETHAIATGETTHVSVHIREMRFIPDLVEVPLGNRLEIEVHNDGDQAHDLALDNGAHLPRLAPGQSATLDVGVVEGDMEGWCTIAGHKQLGMVFHVRTAGGEHKAQQTPSEDRSDTPEVDLAKPMDPTRYYDPTLSDLDDSDVTTHQVTLDISEEDLEAAPGLTQHLWTFNHTTPGPILHGKVGDTFEITLVNNGTMGHSIDFHAGRVAPDEPMRTIEPGEQLTYTFVAERAGIWMYHCATSPMSLHIANGMYGAVVIDPPNLSAADETFVFVHGESYYGAEGQIADGEKIPAGRHDTTHFNGYPNQYTQRPINVKVGEKIRIWVLNAGPNVPLSFHMVGGQFDEVFKEGAYLLRANNPEHGGSQALSLLPAEGGFVDLTFEEPGNYVAVNHVMSEAERGARAVFHVTP
ncbi:MAG: multicopper oxidase domain-containing protein [Bowdeniella nasicola]|nr:multicopper oxidase domain-containing protein [Bowdeniella nasicola]